MKRLESASHVQDSQGDPETVFIGRVVEGFGEGRVVGASDALKMGMVDRVETKDEMLKRLAMSPARATIPRARAENFGIEKERAAHLRLRDALARGGP